MKFTYSKLAKSAFMVSHEHLQDYLIHLDELDQLYWYKADCKRLARIMISLLEAAEKMEVAALARVAIRTIADLTLQAGNYSNDVFTGEVETNVGLIEHELTEFIKAERAAVKRKAQKQPKLAA